VSQSSHNPTRGRRSPGPPAGPRRVRGGLRLKSRDGLRAAGWIAQQWLAVVERAVSADAMRDGLAYARSGQVVAIELVPGRMAARVQGTASQPYRTTLAITPFTDEQWQCIAEAMAAEAQYPAALLAGELPPSIRDLLVSLGLPLLPDCAVDIGCSCPVGGPCKHAAAAACLMAERLSDDPLIVLELYGLCAERLLERVRQARAIHTLGVAAAHADPLIPESQVEPPSLEECASDYWRAGPRLAELEQAAPPQHVRHALLRRLGPPPMGGRFPILGLLASVYDTVAHAAITIRDKAEHIADEESRQ
jgi:uncharacterized Zn finger protein